MPVMVTFNCEYCSKKVEQTKGRYTKNGYKGNTSKYCSRSCSAKSKINKVKVECPRCNKEFEITPSKARDGYRYCTDKCRLQALANKKLDKETLRDNVYFWRMKVKYGLSREEWQGLYDKHGGCCHICKQPETEIHMGRVRRLDVDHCHKTNKVRGLLCTKHNKLLGCAQDNIEILKAAIAYLEFANETT